MDKKADGASLKEPAAAPGFTRWRLWPTHYAGTDLYIEGPEGRVANICGHDAEAYANARLISCAPEMFDALEELKTLAENVIGHSNLAMSPQFVRDRCEAILAKVRGEGK